MYTQYALCVVQRVGAAVMVGSRPGDQATRLTQRSTTGRPDSS